MENTYNVYEDKNYSPYKNSKYYTYKEDLELILNKAKEYKTLNKFLTAKVGQEASGAFERLCQFELHKFDVELKEAKEIASKLFNIA